MNLCTIYRCREDLVDWNHTFSGGAVGLFSAYNAIYYTEEAVANYYVRQTEAKLKAKTK